jgi:hypothetical protein
MSSLNGKKYEEIYGPLEAEVQRSICSARAKTVAGHRPNFSFRGWSHTPEAKQRISQSESRTKQANKRRKELLAAIQLITSEMDKPSIDPKLHDAALSFFAMLSNY